MPKSDTTSDKFKADVLDVKVDMLLTYFDDANTPRSMPFAAGDIYAHASWLGLIEHVARSETPFAHRMTDAGIARRKVLIAAQADDQPAVTVPVPPGSEIQFPRRTDASHLDVTLRIEEERLRRMKRENDIAECKLVPADAAHARYEEKLDEALAMLKAMLPHPVSWNEISG